MCNDIGNHLNQCLRCDNAEAMWKAMQIYKRLVPTRWKSNAHVQEYGKCIEYVVLYDHAKAMRKAMQIKKHRAHDLKT